jgi:hypothetical protein
LKKLLSIGIIFLLLTSTFLSFLPISQVKAEEHKVWTDKPVYYIGETISIYVSPTPAIGVGYWLIIYIPDGTKLRYNLSIGEDVVTFQARYPTGQYKVELWGQVVYPEATPGLCAYCYFEVRELKTGTYTITFLTEPPDVGSITFSGTTYTNGQSGEYTAGTYQIEANIPKGYIFYNWITTGGVSVANSESRQTTASVTGSGSVVAVFKWFVKLRGIVMQYPSWWNPATIPAVVVKVEELLLDTSNRLKVDEDVVVYRETPFTEISDGDRVEVYGLGFWIGNPPGGPYVEYGIVIKWPEHYVKKIEGKLEVDVKFRGTVILVSPDYVEIKIEEILLDPTGNLKAGMIAHVTFLKDFPNVEEVKFGDSVEVYGALKGIEDNVVKISLEKTEHSVKKVTKAYIKSVILNRVSTTTQTGLFIAIGPDKISEIVGEPFAWMPGLGVWVSITVKNKDTKSFDGYLKAFLKSPSERVYETAKGEVHIDPEKEETYFAPIYYYDIFSGVKGTETGVWHVYIELFEGTSPLFSKKIDEARPADLMVVEDEVIIAPDPYFWSAGDVIPIEDFIKADKPSIIEKYYEPLNLFFLIMQALAKVKSPETLNTILPPPTRVSDPSIISSALAGSTDFDVKIRDLGRNCYNITVTYTVLPYDITVFGKNYHFVNWYDRIHVELTFPSILEVIDTGDAHSHVTYKDGKTYVAWFDIYCDKLLYPTPGALQRTKSHSIKVSIKDPISACAIVEGYAYFEVGPFDLTSLESFPIINYQKWKENPSEIAWILFVTKRDQEIISLIPTETGNLATLKPVHISTNSTVIKVTSDRENQKIVIELEGPSGTRGFMNITIAKDLALIGSLQPVIKVYFDSNPQSYKLVELDGSLLISLEYTHSMHTLELYYGSKAPQVIVEFKTLGILIMVGILLSTAMTYLLYRRRRHRIVKISS